MRKNGTSPEERPTRGRPRRYSKKRMTSTMRFLPDHHEFLELAAFLRGKSMAQILEEAITEYAERHHAELQELRAAKKVRMPKTASASGASESSGRRSGVP
jgi:hypothetical protein